MFSFPNYKIYKFFGVQASENAFTWFSVTDRVSPSDTCIS